MAQHVLIIESPPYKKKKNPSKIAYMYIKYTQLKTLLLQKLKRIELNMKTHTHPLVRVCVCVGLM